MIVTRHFTWWDYVAMGQIEFDINLMFIVFVGKWDLKNTWCRELGAHMEEYFSNTEESCRTQGLEYRVLVCPV